MFVLSSQLYLGRNGHSKWPSERSLNVLPHKSASWFITMRLSTIAIQTTIFPLKHLSEGQPWNICQANEPVIYYYFIIIFRFKNIHVSIFFDGPEEPYIVDHSVWWKIVSCKIKNFQIQNMKKHIEASSNKNAILLNKNSFLNFINLRLKIE